MTLHGVVFGWYHKKNAGDDRIAHCIEHWLGDHELTFLPHTYSPPLEILQRSDYVILGGGSIANQVHGVFQNMRHWIDATKIPVFGVSLTVSQYEEFRKELSVIPETGGTIWVRDSKSAEWLDFDNGVVFGSDISWLYPRTFSHEFRTEKVGVNFRPWSKIEWNPESWRTELQQVFGNKVVPWPLCFGKDADLDVLRSMIDAETYPTEFDPTLPSRSQLIIAMRYHAIIFAIQAGTPFIAVDNSRKVRDLLEQVELSHMSVPLDDSSNLEKVSNIAANTVNSQLLNQITAEMSEKTWKVADLMKEKIEQAAYKHRSQKNKLTFKLRRKYNNLKELMH